MFLELSIQTFKFLKVVVQILFSYQIIPGKNFEKLTRLSYFHNAFYLFRSQMLWMNHQSNPVGPVSVSWQNI